MSASKYDICIFIYLFNLFFVDGPSQKESLCCTCLRVKQLFLQFINKKDNPEYVLMAAAYSEESRFYFI